MFSLEMNCLIIKWFLGLTGLVPHRLGFIGIFFGRVNKDASPISLPMGASIFPKEIMLTSRRVAEKVYTNIVHWNELDRGGHFAALECPMQFVDEIRNSFRIVG